jgi:hypothetical protein
MTVNYYKRFYFFLECLCEKIYEVKAIKWFYLDSVATEVATTGGVWRR